MRSLFGGWGTTGRAGDRGSLFAGVGTTAVVPAAPPVPGVPLLWNKRYRDSRPGDAVPDETLYPLRKQPAQGWRCEW